MVNGCACGRVFDLICHSVASFPALPSFPSTESWGGPGHETITTSMTIFLYQLAQARPHNVLHFLVHMLLCDIIISEVASGECLCQTVLPHILQCCRRNIANKGTVIFSRHTGETHQGMICCDSSV